MIRINKPFIYLNTKNTSLIFEIKKYFYENEKYNKEDCRFITQRYYGPSLKEDLSPTEALLHPWGSCQDYCNDYLISSSFGNGSNAESSFLIINENNNAVTRLFYKSSDIIKGGKDIDGPHGRNPSETLHILEKDDVSGIEVHHYYSLFEDSDVIVCKKEIVNTKQSVCHIRKVSSLECHIPTRSVSINTFDGAWIKEKTRHTVNLESGVFVNQSFMGSSSHKHNPYIEVIDNESTLHYGFNLIYSGNHKESVEINPTEHTSIIVGINDFGFDFTLNKGESFITPEAIMIVNESSDGLTFEMHNFINNHIIDPNFRYKDRPILFNSWEGSTFNIEESSLLEMADYAKEMGIELFVVDDGWFGHRPNDLSGLGDWFVDKSKFPNGIGEFAKKIKSKGLQLGLWFEPECISIDSDLFRKHPEYAQLVPGYAPFERRNQLVIDMANQEVVDCLFDMIGKVIDETNLDYIKWDFNRMITDAYSSTGIRCGEYMHRFVIGTYQLLDRLTSKYPHVLFESCSSGGGRYDLGIFYYNPQMWGSDNSNSFHRSHITCGTLAIYPQSTYGAHVSRDFSITKHRSSLEDRFNINSIGAFGYEMDIRKDSKEDLDIIKKQISYYKEHRHLIQFGHYYCVDNCFDDDRYYSFVLVSDDQQEAIMSAIELSFGVPKKKWKFKGLNPSTIYEIEMRPQENAQTKQFPKMSGQELMTSGLDLGSLYDETDSKDYQKGIYSRMIYIKGV